MFNIGYKKRFLPNIKSKGVQNLYGKDVRYHIPNSGVLMFLIQICFLNMDALLSAV